MTILLPPLPKPRHKCPGTGGLWDNVPMRPLGTLMECPECGRWWKYREQYQDAADMWESRYGWFPVSAFDIPARRRIAAHETEKWHAQLRMTLQRTTARRHWWDCHPNPNRGRP